MFVVVIISMGRSSRVPVGTCANTVSRKRVARIDWLPHTRNPCQAARSVPRICRQYNGSPKVLQYLTNFCRLRARSSFTRITSAAHTTFTRAVQIRPDTFAQFTTNLYHLVHRNSPPTPWPAMGITPGFSKICCTYPKA
jgi:hypothetical protein